jgi:hypothetical protein
MAKIGRPAKILSLLQSATPAFAKTRKMLPVGQSGTYLPAPICYTGFGPSRNFRLFAKSC